MAPRAAWPFVSFESLDDVFFCERLAVRIVDRGKHTSISSPSVCSTARVSSSPTRRYYSMPCLASRVVSCTRVCGEALLNHRGIERHTRGVLFLAGLMYAIVVLAWGRPTELREGLGSYHARRGTQEKTLRGTLHKCFGGCVGARRLRKGLASYA